MSDPTQVGPGTPCMFCGCEFGEHTGDCPTLVPLVPKIAEPKCDRLNEIEARWASIDASLFAKRYPDEWIDHIRRDLPELIAELRAARFDAKSARETIDCLNGMRDDVAIRIADLEKQSAENDAVATINYRLAMSQRKRAEAAEADTIRWQRIVEATADEATRRIEAAEFNLLALQNAVAFHHKQRADDRCWEDDNVLYAAAGLPPGDFRVGDKTAMLSNCARFIEQRCEGGHWPSYMELEAQAVRLQAVAKVEGAKPDR